jgi:hypothetical protein
MGLVARLPNQTTQPSRSFRDLVHLSPALYGEAQVTEVAFVFLMARSTGDEHEHEVSLAPSFRQPDDPIVSGASFVSDLEPAHVAIEIDACFQISNVHREVRQPGVHGLILNSPLATVTAAPPTSTRSSSAPVPWAVA